MTEVETTQFSSENAELEAEITQFLAEQSETTTVEPEEKKAEPTQAQEAGTKEDPKPDDAPSEKTSFYSFM